MRYLSIAYIFLFICQLTNHKNIEVKKEYFFIANNSALQTQNISTDSILENKIIDTLLKLSFIKQSSRYIDSLSKHKHGISFIFDKEKDNEIFVRAGYNGPLRFETYYQIYFNSKTVEIKIYDPIIDKNVSVEEFEKSKKH